MGRWGKLVDQMQRSRTNVRFNDLCNLVTKMGYSLDRTKGSHRHYRRASYPAINLQEGKGGKAKPYQVAQVLDILVSMGIEVDS